MDTYALVLLLCAAFVALGTGMIISKDKKVHSTGLVIVAVAVAVLIATMTLNGG